MSGHIEGFAGRERYRFSPDYSTLIQQPIYITQPQYSDISSTEDWNNTNTTEDEPRSPPPKIIWISSPEARPSTITEDISDEEDEESTPTLPLLAITEGRTTPTFDSTVCPSMSVISSIGTPLQDEDRDEVISAATTTVTLRMFRHEEILRDGCVRVSRETALKIRYLRLVLLNKPLILHTVIYFIYQVFIQLEWRPTD